MKTHSGIERRILHDRRINNKLEADEHLLHHAFIRELLQEKAEHRAFMEKLKSSVIGWFVIAVLGGVGLLVFRGLRLTMEAMR